jgi:peptide-methionine (S)-S-oxide reductase
MGELKILDELFRQAVSAIDAGDVHELEHLLAANPRLACERLDAPGAWLRDKIGGALDGFFQKPYLLWFVAEDPVRNGTLPRNIVDVACTIMCAAQQACSDTLREQLDYALQLVSWSWIARQCGVQIELLDALIDAGASTDGAADNALVNGNVAAAEHLVTRGAALTLSTALCLGRWEDASRLAGSATSREKQFALTLAALRGNAEALRRIIDMGVDVNAMSPDLYSHATPLHHAVYSGSLDAVRVLVEAGANLSVRDTAYDATPIGWAEHSKGKQPYDEIAAYLRHSAGVSM